MTHYIIFDIRMRPALRGILDICDHSILIFSVIDTTSAAAQIHGIVADMGNLSRTGVARGAGSGGAVWPNISGGLGKD